MIYNKELFDELEKLGWPAYDPSCGNNSYSFHHATVKICVQPVDRKGPNSFNRNPSITRPDDGTRCTMACLHKDAKGEHKVKPIRIDMAKKHWRKHLMKAYTVMVMSVQAINDVYAERDDRLKQMQQKKKDEYTAFCAPLGVEASEFAKAFRHSYSDKAGYCSLHSTVGYSLSNTEEKCALLFKYLKDNDWLGFIDFTTPTTY
jgi:hypothetical protein